ncbi:hypothetical protein OQA88_4812 [Cercophora sp. LCS_1]
MAAPAPTPISPSDEVDPSWKDRPEFPDREEILDKQTLSSLPENIVDRPWPSKDAFLRALYEILRCEATEGLRYSVVECHNKTLVQQLLQDSEFTWVYAQVRVKAYLFARLGPIARVEFVPAMADNRRINWIQSRRLTPGKIVAISTKADGFRSICKIATIAQRTYRGGLDQDPPQVDLMWANPADAELDPEAELIIVEPRNGFFEASRHALVGLQELSRKGSPLLDRLTGVKTGRSHPNFVLARPIMDLGPLIHREGATPAQARALRAHNIVASAMPILGDVTSLDHSQMEALQQILSQDLAIVQGPPGTGKTFTTVEAIKAMVATRRTKGGGPPVIVAAQTNHALDHVLSYCLKAGVKLLRVGGRASTQEMKDHGIYNLRSRAKFPMDKATRDFASRRQENINRIQSLVDHAFGDSLIDPEALLGRGIITEEQYDSLVDESMECHPDTEKLGPFGLWLGESRIRAEILRDRHKAPEFYQLPEEEEEEYELSEGEAENIADDEEDEDRIKGRLIELAHVWTGKEPSHLTSWTRTAERELKRPDLFTIPVNNRGAVYKHLQAKLLAVLRVEFSKQITENVRLCREEARLRNKQDAGLVRSENIDVIGCTTTGLTKYRALISALSPRTLLVEEASETREANIVSALYPSIQQLVLVGDHEQLAPHCDVQWLGQPPYNIDISLFQRMVNIGMPFTMLKVQRRMRPELRSILSHVYPELTDHPLVRMKENRPDIPGMGGRNCWFFDHSWPEQTNSDHSKFNEDEAHMVANFFTYLVNNGTKPEQITVLTFYTGQRRVILEILNRHPGLPHEKFNVCTVDSYQGKENDVILLSLVRSPRAREAPSVGFLEDQRRAVVAISRARRGFYIFGNVENVVTAGVRSGDIWTNTWNGFANQHAVDRRRGIQLECQNHGRSVWIKTLDDWARNSGGCSQPCGQTRPCGHKCTIMCHPSPHQDLRCSEPCTNWLECGHGCQKWCGEECYCDCDQFETTKAESDARRAAMLERLGQSNLTLEEHLLKETGESVLLKTELVRQKIYGQLNGPAPKPSVQGLPTRPRAFLHGRNLNAVPVGSNHRHPQPAKSSTQEKWKLYTNNVAKHDEQLGKEIIGARAQEKAVRATDAKPPMIKDVYRPTTVVKIDQLNYERERGKRNVTQLELLPATGRGPPVDTEKLPSTPSASFPDVRSAPSEAPENWHWIQHRPDTAPVYPYRLPLTPLTCSPTKTASEAGNFQAAPPSPATTRSGSQQILVDFEDVTTTTNTMWASLGESQPTGSGALACAGRIQTDLLSEAEPIPWLSAESSQTAGEEDLIEF